MIPKNDWSIQSPSENGFFAIFEAGKSVCKALSFYRLNMSAGDCFEYNSQTQEMNFVLVKGEAKAEFGLGDFSMKLYDAFYVPGGTDVKITAVSDLIFYIPAAVCEGYGKPFFRKFEEDLPVGDIHQVHGKGSCRREVYFTLDTAVPASRLVCGYAFGGEGGWTSWKAHQHSESLEEAYCYFGMGEKYTGYQLCYQTPGDIAHADIYPVKDGTIAMIPEGYHPTVSLPGSKNTYLWVMASFDHARRRYDLAIDDPEIDW